METPHIDAARRSEPYAGNIYTCNVCNIRRFSNGVLLDRSVMSRRQKGMMGEN